MGDSGVASDGTNMFVITGNTTFTAVTGAVAKRLFGCKPAQIYRSAYRLLGAYKLVFARQWRHGSGRGQAQ